MTDPETALPLCVACNGKMSRGVVKDGEWTCMRCWGGWLAGAPERRPDDMVVFGGSPDVEYKPEPMAWDFEAPPPPVDVRISGSSFDCPSVTFEPMPGALDWSDA